MKENKIVLPRTYTKELWEIGGCRPEHEKFIGLNYLSWSQLEAFNDSTGFNTGLLGEYEYIRKYFSNDEYPDLYGFGLTGHAIETYITLRNEDPEKLDAKTREALDWAINHFTEEGKKLLETIKPLGVFQREVCYYIDSLDVIILGYTDDMTPIVDNNIKLIRDYKSKSKSSKKDLHLDKKFQLEIYQSAEEKLGYTVDGCEYCIIERSGGYACMQGGGVEALNIGEEIWYEPYRKLTPERKKQMDDMLIKTIIRISDYYEVFLKITDGGRINI